MLGVLAAAGAMSGCASSATKVTLLPDQSGHVGAVTVSDAQGQQRIDQAFNTVAVEHSRPHPARRGQTIARRSKRTIARCLMRSRPRHGVSR